MNKTLFVSGIAALACLALAPGPAVAERVLKSNEVTADSFTKAMLAPPPKVESEFGPGVRGRTVMARPTSRPGVSVLITFETNSAELTPAAKTALDQIGQALTKDQLAKFNFTLEGHADPRGASDMNQRLSQARAESVVQYLVSNHGVTAERLQPVGKGDKHPLRPQQPAAPENRRVTFVPSNR